ncbi:hypothetical protein ACTXL8_10555, partial [Glutamicibacter arilaitensis]|uniref:hypothetical protein n=2 Tax=Glutamicibacter TaxID=1742989 RepID=UPI003FD3B541
LTFRAWNELCQNIISPELDRAGWTPNYSEGSSCNGTPEKYRRIPSSLLKPAERLNRADLKFREAMGKLGDGHEQRTVITLAGYLRH